MNVKVNDIKKEGLYWEFESILPAKEIIDEVEEQLKERQKTFQMAGYREGKVDMAIVKKNLGPEILTKIIERRVDDSLKHIFEERNVRPALQPQVEVNAFDENKDLKYQCKVELFPEVPEVSWDDIEVENVIISVLDEDVTKAHDDIIKNFKNFDDAPAAYAAKKGDAVIVDFVGKMNEKEFDGGKGEDVRLELGSNSFIPGFEDQLIGAKAGSKLKVRVVFPKAYHSKELAGKPAVFDVEVKSVMQPSVVSKVDDEFAKKLGVENLEKLNELIKQKLEADYAGLARLRLKKVLFDLIDDKYRFDVPVGMLKIDFETMWNEIKMQKDMNPQAFKGKTEDQMKREYLEIAKRRVRLGIILAEIARENSIEVNDADLQQAMFTEAMMRPGQEKMIFDFYAKAENLERLRGPILEEKAVDHVLTKVKKKDLEITSKEFFDKYAQDLNPTTQGA
jgi:trigger factor